MINKITSLIFCLCLLFMNGIFSQTQPDYPDKEVAAYKTLEKVTPGTLTTHTVDDDDDNDFLPLDAVVIWGGPGDANGEFDGGLNDWTTTGFSKIDDDLEALWKWEADGDAAEGNFYTGLPPIASPSVANGAAVFDSDFLDNNGMDNNFGNGPAPGPQYSELISPTIDLTNHTDVALSFFSFYRNFNTDVYVSFSNDDGASWSENIELFARTGGNELIQPDTESLIYLDGSGGTDQFKFKFIWDGNYYFWIIDDVAIIERPHHDLVLDGVFYTPLTYGQPEGQIDSDEFFFDFYISNRGAAAQTNVQMTAQIFDSNDNMIWENTTVVDEIPARITDSIELDSTFLPVGLDIGEYRMEYFISADSTDQWERDNDKNTLFAVTNSVFQAETGDSDFEEEQIIGTNVQWEIGNEYVTGADFMGEPFIASSVTFAPVDFSAAESLDGKSALVAVLERTDNFLYGDNNNFLEDQNLVLTAISSIDFTNEGQGQLVTLPMQPGSGSVPILLKENTRYFVLVSFQQDSTGNVFNDEVEYTGRQRFVAYAGGSWFGRFSESELIPLVRMNLGILSHTDDNPLPESAMNIYPNPVGDQLTAEIDLEVASKAAITISDVSGQIHQKRDFNLLGKSSIQFDTSDLANGMHFIRLVTPEGTRTIKFVVQ